VFREKDHHQQQTYVPVILSNDSYLALVHPILREKDNGDIVVWGGKGVDILREESG